MKNIIFALLAFIAIDSNACSVSKERSLSDKFAAADHVALVKIISTRLVVDGTKKDVWERETVEATYEVIEAFKGKHNPPIAREMVFGPGNCMMGLLAGNTYILFLEGPQRAAGWLGGSQMLWNVDGTAVKPMLVELRSMKEK